MKKLNSADLLYDLNFEEFKKLDSFERQKDFYSDFCLKMANKGFQIFIYAVHKQKNKYIKLYILKGFHIRPRITADINLNEVIDFFECWDNDYKTHKSNFIRFLHKTMEFIH